VKIWITLLQSVIFDPDRNELSVVIEILENSMWVVMNIVIIALSHEILATEVFGEAGWSDIRLGLRTG